MIRSFKFLSLFLGFLLIGTTLSEGESSTCLILYKQGGAPAVFKSPKCPRWKHPTYVSPHSRSNSRCQIAMLQGRRKFQEDRTLCVLDVRIPFPGNVGIKEVMVGIVAVFDGHNGAEASEMSSRLLLEYFLLHTYFLLDATYSVLLKKPGGSFQYTREHGTVPQVHDWDYVLGRHELNFGSMHDVFIFEYRNAASTIVKDILKLSKLTLKCCMLTGFVNKYSIVLFPRPFFVLTTLSYRINGLIFKLSSLAENFGDYFHLEILKEALLRALHDIDSTFSKDASVENIESGSTATVILLADGQILVANIGDSKAFLCSKRFQSPAEAKATYLRLYRQERRNGAIVQVRNSNNMKLASSTGMVHFSVKELTRDHHPNRDDERYRVESAGGYVLEWGGVPRINGQLAISRAIGDVSFKSYGVISAPELTDWQPLTKNDSYLVAASDGVFEKLSLQDVCDLLWEGRGKCVCSSCSLADCIVNTAFEKGSMDNMAAIVVPMVPTIFSENLEKERLVVDGDLLIPVLGPKASIGRLSVGDASDIAQMEHGYPMISMFDRLLVEGKHGYVGCFYLLENLAQRIDYKLPAEKVNLEEHVYDVQKALPEDLNQHFGGPLNLYHDRDFCFLRETGDSAKAQCINPEGFASFVGLLESIPFHDANSADESFEYADFRYVLKRRFGRGSYGEVWLAFHWNCYQSDNSSQSSETSRNSSYSSINFDSYIGNSSSSTNNCHSGSLDENLFILKRIMVERGPTVYLSGLREKHFGELFLNASKSLGGLTSAGASTSVLEETHFSSHDILETNVSTFHETGNSWSLGSEIPNMFRLQGPIYEEGLNHIARYVESFESRANEIWLVFQYEGVSLSKLMYTVEEADSNADEEKADNVKHIQMLHPSKWWHWLKTTKAGQEEMRNLLWQLLLGLKSCHDRNVTHRDIKPENMVICFEDLETGRCMKGIPNAEEDFITKMRIIDFGSAMDEFTIKNLYGANGPSRSEQTNEYTPPEALLHANWYHGPISTTSKYDMWSVGIIILELILGSPNVFQISAYTRALLDQHLEGWNEGLKELAYRLRSFMELCILIPGSSVHHHIRSQVGASPASWKCSEEFFSSQIKSRDPLKKGFQNVWLLRLVRNLLVWEPEERLSVDDALRHPYFHPSSSV